jgi:hypothetical protein
MIRTRQNECKSETRHQDKCETITNDNLNQENRLRRFEVWAIIIFLRLSCTDDVKNHFRYSSHALTWRRNDVWIKQNKQNKTNIDVFVWCYELRWIHIDELNFSDQIISILSFIKSSWSNYFVVDSNVVFIFTSETNFTKNSNSFSLFLSLDLSDFEKQFDNDLNLDKTNKKTLNKYVLYRFTQYTLLNNVDYDL